MAPSVLPHTINFAYPVAFAGEAVQSSCPMQQSNCIKRASLRRVLMSEEGGVGNMMNVLKIKREVRVIESVQRHKYG